MARDVMAVRLHLPQIRVLEVVEDTPGALVVSVESTFRRLRCAQCGFKCRRVHDRRDKKIRDLEVSGRRTVLVWSRRRMVCDNCDSRFLEDHPAFEGALTGRLARRLVADAKVMTFSAAARRHGVHWHAVRALVDTWSALVAERRRSRRCSVLLVDETSMRKRHRYVTVIVNGDTGRTLAMVEHRNAAALSAFLMQQGHRWCKQVKVVVSDGSRAYKAAIDAHLGHARHVLDRFHVIRWFAAGLTQVRRDIQRRQPPGVKPAFDPEVFRARFALLRRGDTLTDTDRARLDKLFDAHPRLKAGWQALQELHGLYTADDYDGALEALGRFCDLYQTGELPEVFRARFALLRRGDTLTDTDRARLDKLFDAHPRLKAGWQALQELHGLYTADDYDGALEALGRFCDLYQTGELPEYHDTVDTFIAWSDEILNWHCAGRPSNGRIEGTNNLLQVLRRTAHGFTNPRNFEARGILVT